MIRRAPRRATSSRIPTRSRSAANRASISPRMRSAGDTRTDTGVGPLSRAWRFFEWNLRPSSFTPAQGHDLGLGLRELLGTHVELGEAPGRANVADKAMTLLHSALAGGSWIDDCDRLRAGSIGQVLGHRVLAPSTIGTFLRSFSFGHARQLDAVSGQALQRAWQQGAGPGAGPLTIDVDSTICEVYGTHKQGAEFGHTKVRGYHPLLAFAAGTWDLLHSRLRGGSAYTARGAASFVAETIGRVRAAGATGPLTLRADSGFYARTVVTACQRHGVRYSITAKLTKAVRKVIEQLPEDAWIPIPYWLEDGADVAETSYRPFGKKGTLVRLIRRVRPTPGSQLALFTTYDYHPFITDPGRQHPGAGGRPPSPRRGRTGHLRPQTRRRPAAPALGAVWRQRRLAGPVRDGLQPGPLDHPAGRGRGAHEPQDAAGALPGAARPAFGLGPPAHPAPARPLAVAVALPVGPGP